jgi:hypothetical protein
MIDLQIAVEYPHKFRVVAGVEMNTSAIASYQSVFSKCVIPYFSLIEGIRG